jgi:hypothetical protein
MRNLDRSMRNLDRSIHNLDQQSEPIRAQSGSTDAYAIWTDPFEMWTEPCAIWDDPFASRPIHSQSVPKPFRGIRQYPNPYTGTKLTQPYIHILYIYIRHMTLDMCFHNVGFGWLQQRPKYTQKSGNDFHTRLTHFGDICFSFMLEDGLNRRPLDG